MRFDGPVRIRKRALRTPHRCLPAILSLALTGLLAVAQAGCTTSADNQRINGDQALKHVENLIRHGPHSAGTQSQKQVGLYIIEQLKSFGLQPQTHRFKPLTPSGQLEMINIWSVLPGRGKSTVILASHYDTKMFADFKFVGANDSGSSTGIVLELARVLSAHNPTDATFWFVFFDGEEAQKEWTQNDSLYGSREFVRMLTQSKQIQNISALILLDMVGEKDLKIPQDLNSTEWLRSLIWKKGAELGHGNIFVSSQTMAAEDDHIPFVRAGVPAVDVIDLDYAHWHRATDTLDKLSAENMEVVGNVILASLPDIVGRLNRGQ